VRLLVRLAVAQLTLTLHVPPWRKVSVCFHPFCATACACRRHAVAMICNVQKDPERCIIERRSLHTHTHYKPALMHWVDMPFAIVSHAHTGGNKQAR
jgi:hypothetical protein